MNALQDLFSPSPPCSLLHSRSRDESEPRGGGGRAYPDKGISTVSSLSVTFSPSMAHAFSYPEDLPSSSSPPPLPGCSLPSLNSDSFSSVPSLPLGCSSSSPPPPDSLALGVIPPLVHSTSSHHHGSKFLSTALHPTLYSTKHDNPFIPTQNSCLHASPPSHYSSQDACDRPLSSGDHPVRSTVSKESFTPSKSLSGNPESNSIDLPSSIEATKGDQSIPSSSVSHHHHDHLTPSVLHTPSPTPPSFIPPHETSNASLTQSSSFSHSFSSHLHPLPLQAFTSHLPPSKINTKPWRSEEGGREAEAYSSSTTLPPYLSTPYSNPSKDTQGEAVLGTLPPVTGEGTMYQQRLHNYRTSLSPSSLSQISPSHHTCHGSPSCHPLVSQTEGTTSHPYNGFHETVPQQDSAPPVLLHSVGTTYYPSHDSPPSSTVAPPSLFLSSLSHHLEGRTHPHTYFSPSPLPSSSSCPSSFSLPTSPPPVPSSQPDSPDASLVLYSSPRGNGQSGETLLGESTTRTFPFLSRVEESTPQTSTGHGSSKNNETPHQTGVRTLPYIWIREKDKSGEMSQDGQETRQDHLRDPGVNRGCSAVRNPEVDIHQRCRTGGEEAVVISSPLSSCGEKVYEGVQREDVFSLRKTFPKEESFLVSSERCRDDAVPSLSGGGSVGAEQSSKVIHHQGGEEERKNESSTSSFASFLSSPYVHRRTHEKSSPSLSLSPGPPLPHISDRLEHDPPLHHPTLLTTERFTASPVSFGPSSYPSSSSSSSSWPPTPLAPFSSSSSSLSCGRKGNLLSCTQSHVDITTRPMSQGPTHSENTRQASSIVPSAAMNYDNGGTSQCSDSSVSPSLPSSASSLVPSPVSSSVSPPSPLVGLHANSFLNEKSCSSGEQRPSSLLSQKPHQHQQQQGLYSLREGERISTDQNFAGSFSAIQTREDFICPSKENDVEGKGSSPLPRSSSFSSAQTNSELRPLDISEQDSCFESNFDHTPTPSPLISRTHEAHRSSLERNTPLCSSSSSHMSQPHDEISLSSPSSICNDTHHYRRRGIGGRETKMSGVASCQQGGEKKHRDAEETGVTKGPPDRPFRLASESSSRQTVLKDDSRGLQIEKEDKEQDTYRISHSSFSSFSSTPASTTATSEPHKYGNGVGASDEKHFTAKEGIEPHPSLSRPALPLAEMNMKTLLSSSPGQDCLTSTQKEIEKDSPSFLLPQANQVGPLYSGVEGSQRHHASYCLNMTPKEISSREEQETLALPCSPLPPPCPSSSLPPESVSSLLQEATSLHEIPFLSQDANAPPSLQRTETVSSSSSSSSVSLPLRSLPSTSSSSSFSSSSSSFSFHPFIASSSGDTSYELGPRRGAPSLLPSVPCQEGSSLGCWQVSSSSSLRFHEREDRQGEEAQQGSSEPSAEIPSQIEGRFDNGRKEQEEGSTKVFMRRTSPTHSTGWMQGSVTENEEVKCGVNFTQNQHRGEEQQKQEEEGDSSSLDPSSFSQINQNEKERKDRHKHNPKSPLSSYTQSHQEEKSFFSLSSDFSSSTTRQADSLFLQRVSEVRDAEAILQRRIEEKNSSFLHEGRYEIKEDEKENHQATAGDAKEKKGGKEHYEDPLCDDVKAPSHPHQQTSSTGLSLVKEKDIGEERDPLLEREILAAHERKDSFPREPGRATVEPSDSLSFFSSSFCNRVDQQLPHLRRDRLSLAPSFSFSRCEEENEKEEEEISSLLEKIGKTSMSTSLSFLPCDQSFAGDSSDSPHEGCRSLLSIEDSSSMKRKEMRGEKENPSTTKGRVEGEDGSDGHLSFMRTSSRNKEMHVDKSEIEEEERRERPYSSPKASEFSHRLGGGGEDRGVGCPSRHTNEAIPQGQDEKEELHISVEEEERESDEKKRSFSAERRREEVDTVAKGKEETEREREDMKRQGPSPSGSREPPRLGIKRVEGGSSLCNRREHQGKEEKNSAEAALVSQEEENKKDDKIAETDEEIFLGREEKRTSQEDDEKTRTTTIGDLLNQWKDESDDEEFVLTSSSREEEEDEEGSDDEQQQEEAYMEKEGDQMTKLSRNPSPQFKASQKDSSPGRRRMKKKKKRRRGARRKQEEKSLSQPGESLRRRYEGCGVSRILLPRESNPIEVEPPSYASSSCLEGNASSLLTEMKRGGLLSTEKTPQETSLGERERKRQRDHLPLREEKLKKTDGEEGRRGGEEEDGEDREQGKHEHLWIAKTHISPTTYTSPSLSSSSPSPLHLSTPSPSSSSSPSPPCLPHLSRLDFPSHPPGSSSSSSSGSATSGFGLLLMQRLLAGDLSDMDGEDDSDYSLSDPTDEDDEGEDEEEEDREEEDEDDEYVEEVDPLTPLRFKFPRRRYACKEREGAESSSPPGLLREKDQDSQDSSPPESEEEHPSTEFALECTDTRKRARDLRRMKEQGKPSQDPGRSSASISSTVMIPPSRMDTDDKTDMNKQQTSSPSSSSSSFPLPTVGGNLSKCSVGSPSPFSFTRKRSKSSGRASRSPSCDGGRDRSSSEEGKEERGPEESFLPSSTNIRRSSKKQKLSSSSSPDRTEGIRSLDERKEDTSTLDQVEREAHKNLSALLSSCSSPSSSSSSSLLLSASSYRSRMTQEVPTARGDSQDQGGDPRVTTIATQERRRPTLCSSSSPSLDVQKKKKKAICGRMPRQRGGRGGNGSSSSRNRSHRIGYRHFFSPASSSSFSFHEGNLTKQKGGLAGLFISSASSLTSHPPPLPFPLHHVSHLVPQLQEAIGRHLNYSDGGKEKELETERSREERRRFGETHSTGAFFLPQTDFSCEAKKRRENRKMDGDRRTRENCEFPDAQRKPLMNGFSPPQIQHLKLQLDAYLQLLMQTAYVIRNKCYSLPSSSSSSFCSSPPRRMGRTSQQRGLPFQEEGIQASIDRRESNKTRTRPIASLLHERSTEKRKSSEGMNGYEEEREDSDMTGKGLMKRVLTCCDRLILKRTEQVNFLRCQQKHLPPIQLQQEELPSISCFKSERVLAENLLSYQGGGENNACGSSGGCSLANLDDSSGLVPFPGPVESTLAIDEGEAPRCSLLDIPLLRKIKQFLLLIE
ncbi:hypothetical protein CSUI_005088 [Cystoisospora suis]|uniref:Uncharacterized protein n=1 Tax=Cystoisospora suis TaxID=483139 RepID=A0A2C6KYW0_9APIC|nr:hypothetical protein CSUI_005088 [Cystoisospora suis]